MEEPKHRRATRRDAVTGPFREQRERNDRLAVPGEGVGGLFSGLGLQHWGINFGVAFQSCCWGKHKAVAMDTMRIHHQQSVNKGERF